MATVYLSVVFFWVILYTKRLAGRGSPPSPVSNQHVLVPVLPGSQVGGPFRQVAYLVENRVARVGTYIHVVPGFQSLAVREHSDRARIAQRSSSKFNSPTPFVELRDPIRRSVVN